MLLSWLSVGSLLASSVSSMAVVSLSEAPGLEQQRPLLLQQQHQQRQEQQKQHQRDASWESMGASRMGSSIEHALESIGQTLDQAVESIATTGSRMFGSLVNNNNNGMSRRRGNDRSAMEVIRESRNTRCFAKLLERNEEMRRCLQERNRGGRITVFVPTDEAFEQMGDLDRFSASFVDKIMQYHVVRDEYATDRMMGTHTLPTMLMEPDLGDRPQRLRVSICMAGIQLNFHSRLVASNIQANNAVIHVIDQVLMPPPRQGRLIDQVPGKFSTWSLAMERTGLAAELRDGEQRGGTVFAPTNYAFARLGQAANRFLFSREGAEYLRALLRYHVVTNETLYSDAYYEEDMDGDEDEDRNSNRDQNRNGDRDQDRSRDRNRDRDQDRHRDRDQDRNRDRDQDRNRDRDQDRDQDRNRDRGQNRNGDRDEDRSRDRNRDRDQDRNRDRDQDRNRDRDQDRNRDRDQDRNRDRDQDRNRDRDQDRNRDRDQDRNRDRDQDRDEDRDQDHNRDRDQDRNADNHNQLDVFLQDADDTFNLEPFTQELLYRKNQDTSRLDDLRGRERESRRMGRPSTDIFPRSHWRVEMPTQIESRTLRVDLSRWMGLIKMVVNGRAQVTVQDGVARDGVVHVIETVLIPPRHGGRSGHDEDEDRGSDGDYFDGGEVTVDDLVDRLRKFVNDDQNDDSSRRQGDNRRNRRNDL